MTILCEASSVAVTSAVDALRAGEIVCVPTESSYGLAVDAGNSDAIERLVLAKGRQPGAAFGLIVCDVAQAKAWTGTWPNSATALAQQHWPGPLTLVLPAPHSVSPHLIGQSGGVALRVSSVEFVRRVAGELGRPITATSANPSGMNPATSIDDAYSYFGDAVSLYIDGGTCSAAPSTLVEFTLDGTPRILRQGPVQIPLK